MIEPTPEDIEAVARAMVNGTSPFESDRLWEGSFDAATAAWHAVVARVEARIKESTASDVVARLRRSWDAWCLSGGRACEYGSFAAGYAAGIDAAAKLVRSEGASCTGVHRAWLYSVAEAIRALSPRSEEGRCTCGSGAHPRRCNLHPEHYQQHCDELSAEYEKDADITRPDTQGGER